MYSVRDSILFDFAVSVQDWDAGGSRFGSVLESERGSTGLPGVEF